MPRFASLGSPARGSERTSPVSALSAGDGHHGSVEGVEQRAARTGNSFLGSRVSAYWYRGRENLPIRSRACPVACAGRNEGGRRGRA
eukprot:11598800-Alexandrium_andersonii.AAC.1